MLKCQSLDVSQLNVFLNFILLATKLVGYVIFTNFITTICNWKESMETSGSIQAIMKYLIHTLAHLADCFFKFPTNTVLSCGSKLILRSFYFKKCCDLLKFDLVNVKIFQFLNCQQFYEIKKRIIRLRKVFLSRLNIYIFVTELYMSNSYLFKY